MVHNNKCYIIIIKRTNLNNAITNLNVLPTTDMSNTLKQTIVI